MKDVKLGDVRKLDGRPVVVIGFNGDGTQAQVDHWSGAPWTPVVHVDRLCDMPPHTWSDDALKGLQEQALQGLSSKKWRGLALGTLSLIYSFATQEKREDDITTAFKDEGKALDEAARELEEIKKQRTKELLDHSQAIGREQDATQRALDYGHRMERYLREIFAAAGLEYACESTTADLLEALNKEREQLRVKLANLVDQAQRTTSTLTDLHSKTLDDLEQLRADFATLNKAHEDALAERDYARKHGDGLEDTIVRVKRTIGAAHDEDVEKAALRTIAELAVVKRELATLKDEKRCEDEHNARLAKLGPPSDWQIILDAIKPGERVTLGEIIDRTEIDGGYSVALEYLCDKGKLELFTDEDGAERYTRPVTGPEPQPSTEAKPASMETIVSAQEPTTRTFRRDYLYEDLELPMNADETMLVGHSRWALLKECVFRTDESDEVTLPEGYFWKAAYSVGATEKQDEKPWQYVNEVKCTLVRRGKKMVDAWIPAVMPGSTPDKDVIVRTDEHDETKVTVTLPLITGAELVERIERMPQRALLDVEMDDESADDHKVTVVTADPQTASPSPRIEQMMARQRAIIKQQHAAFEQYQEELGLVLDCILATNGERVLIETIEKNSCLPRDTCSRVLSGLVDRKLVTTHVDESRRCWYSLSELASIQAKRLNEQVEVVTPPESHAADGPERLAQLQAKFAAMSDEEKIVMAARSIEVRDKEYLDELAGMTPDEVDAELRELGLDPVAIGKRGAEVAAQCLAERAAKDASKEHLYPGIVDGKFVLTSDCANGCGAWMGGSRSGAPDGIDPFGECPTADAPEQQIAVIAKNERVRERVAKLLRIDALPAEPALSPTRFNCNIHCVLAENHDGDCLLPNGESVTPPQTLAAMDDNVHVPNDEHMRVVKEAIGGVIEDSDPLGVGVNMQGAWANDEPVDVASPGEIASARAAFEPEPTPAKRHAVGWVETIDGNGRPVEVWFDPATGIPTAVRRDGNAVSSGSPEPPINVVATARKVIEWLVGKAPQTSSQIKLAVKMGKADWDRVKAYLVGVKLVHVEGTGKGTRYSHLSSAAADPTGET